MLGLAVEAATLTAAAAGGTQTLAAAKETSPASKAMWRAIVCNSKCRSFCLQPCRCRLTSSLSLSAAASAAADAAAVARLSQGAPSWFCINLFTNNGEEQHQQPGTSYQESVSTIDSVLCSLPVLTNQLKLASPSSLGSSSSLSGRQTACFQDKFHFSKAYGSAAHAVATFEGASETLEEQNLVAEKFRLASSILTKSSELRHFSFPNESPSLAETSPEQLSGSSQYSSKSFALEYENTCARVESGTLEFMLAESVSSLDTLAAENLTAAFEAEEVFPEGQAAVATDDELTFYEPVQTLDTMDPGVSDTALDEAARAKEALKHHHYMRTMRRKQRKMEMEAYWKATMEYKNMITNMCKKNLAPNVPYVRGLLLSWFEPYRDALLAEQKAILQKEPSIDRSVYGPYLLQLPPDILAVLVMHKLMAVLMREQESGYLRLLSIASTIGDAVEQETEIYRIMSKSKKNRKRMDSTSPQDVAVRAHLQQLMKHQNVRALSKQVKQQRESKPWGHPIHVKVGTRLIDILMDVALIHPPATQSPTQDPPELRPAFKHEQRTVVGKKKRSARKIGVLACDPLVFTSLEKSARFLEMPYMPMLVEPVKWTSYKKGGYIVLRSHLMRTHGARSQQFALARTPKAQLRRVFDALNILGSTPWRINSRILDVVEKIWADGGCLANLVDRDNMELPTRPETEDIEEIKVWRREFMRRKRINAERHSQRCDTELKLSVARKYRKERQFYFPHNVDFRGRAYPMHPYLNHLGSDLCRGLLEFAEGRPLGQTGLWWLKIQLANVFATGGVDKLSFDGRVAFVDENIEDVKDSAEQPLEGRRWWLKAEDPFQCLAACISLQGALESNDLDSYICHTPVHQDGSCNGLQHYAALGRDIVGGESVNLVAGEKPGDVYTGIANRVRQIMERESHEDSSTSNAEHARALIGQVDRKLVKQTVMTSVYGVTYIGARAQIYNRLEERSKEGDSRRLFSESSYAAKATLGALGEMFKEAKGIMNWLAECAKLVAIQNEAVRWCSPLGLPVVQPYRKPGWKQVKTSLQTFIIRNDNDQPVVIQRQKTAFPPNFVHSLDSAHMMMTAIACGEAGLCFAGVHDSFWTHPSDVDKMNQILREKFVELYNQPILEDLLKGFQKSFPDVEFPPLPERGNLDLREVLKSPYFFN